MWCIECLLCRFPLLLSCYVEDRIIFLYMILFFFRGSRLTGARVMNVRS